MQDIRSFEYSVRLEELGGFFRDQHWRHMHDVLRSRGTTFHELGHQGLEASLAILEAEEITRREALREIGIRRRRGALASLAAQGFTEEGGAASASTELGCRGRRGSLASLEAKGFTGEGGGHRHRPSSLIGAERQNRQFTGNLATAYILVALVQLILVSFAKITFPPSPRKVISVGFASGC